MVVRLVWSPEARKDLLDIYVVIGLENPAAGERLYDRIASKADALAHFTRLGPRHPTFDRPRVSYLILFETHPDTAEGPIDRVEIVRGVDGRRDLSNVN